MYLQDVYEWRIPGFGFDPVRQSGLKLINYLCFAAKEAQAFILQVSHRPAHMSHKQASDAWQNFPNFSDSFISYRPFSL